MLRAIVVDDEVHSAETLAILIREYCPAVTTLDKCRSAREALDMISISKPDLLFLDIEMPGMNGFQMLEQLGQISFPVVFTTSYDQYAMRAIRFSALDYLLKPVDSRELIAAVKKVTDQRQLPMMEQFQLLISQLNGRNEQLKKFAIPTLGGFEMITADDLIKCEANDNYTKLYLKNKEKITACRTLKETEEQLRHYKSFLRVHHSYIVNLNEVVNYVRGEGGYLTMSDGSVVNVSRSRKQALMNIL